ncbi:nSTAND1 domain-containing NTPase [Actinophytocola xanthii]|uniref:HTH cro/C1-type domain-containing protein n=1 Tax=Actinophytocola xanthii TaxID=1912961 RepID=A0A1Q8CE36_9PSEU|nr:helix-turn-helix domain-containing protein [Actinophytocola xanthii]OLF12550.1 hypothetical protein BU204_29025 [Actinophytocola xanthii]
MSRPERAIDPDAGVVQRFAFELRRLRHAAGSPGYRELAKRAHYAPTTLAQAARGDRLPSLAVTLAYVRACGGDETGWMARWSSVMRVLAADTDASTRRAAPYPGGASLDAGDGAVLFGRAPLVCELLRLVDEHTLVAVSGPSGSGVSSLLRAGLLPGTGLRAVVLTPGTVPPRECAARTRALTSRRGEDPRLLLVVDQFERVLAGQGDPAERGELVAALRDAAQAGVRVVLGVRADALAGCVAEVAPSARLAVVPMTPDELGAAITQPAARSGYHVETALAVRLVAETVDQPGGLAWLAAALARAWELRSGTTLSLAAYETGGGIAALVAETAENTYRGMDARHQSAARDLLLRLVAPGEAGVPARRRVQLDELDEDDPAVRTALERLTAARLVTVGETTVELAHDAVLTGWPRFGAWLDQARQSLFVRSGLAEASNAWVALGRDPDLLYRGARLTVALEHAGIGGSALNQRERAFLDASHATELAVAGRLARMRRLVVVLMVAVLVLTVIVLTVFAAQRATGSGRAAELSVPEATVAA